MLILFQWVGAVPDQRPAAYLRRSIGFPSQFAVLICAGARQIIRAMRFGSGIMRGNRKHTQLIRYPQRYCNGLFADLRSNNDFVWMAHTVSTLNPPCDYDNLANFYKITRCERRRWAALSVQFLIMHQVRTPNFGWIAPERRSKAELENGARKAISLRSLWILFKFENMTYMIHSHLPAKFGGETFVITELSAACLQRGRSSRDR